MPSLYTLHGPDLLHHNTDNDYPYYLRRRNVQGAEPRFQESGSLAEDRSSIGTDDEETRQRLVCDRTTMASHHSLLRVYGFLFAME